MFLKSLELNGFKSFAQKIVLEFPPGITAIVGPNGAGKSNVIDAIRWLLGEREAKNLRGAKAEDLIFNGTPKKPRLSMAQARLYFDNSSGFFPVDFKEVVINRRVGRDSISQYFINKAEVRLKDVINFFSRSRLGTKGLTIINQGDSDLFVRASAEERRIMIEEILGLREYQIKKIEAERKLKNTFFNLEKARAMIEEVAPRLRTLKRQTNKWAKRVKLQEELEQLEKNYFSYKLNGIRSSQAEIEPALNSFDKQIDEKQKELNILESKLKKIESQPQEYQEIKKIKHKQQELLLERSQIQKELGRLEAKLEFFAADRGDTNNNFKNEDLFGFINEAKQILEEGLRQSNFEKLKSIIKELIDKIDNLLSPAKTEDFKPNALSELEKSRDDLLAKFDTAEKELKKLEKEETDITVNLEEFNKNFQKTFELTESKRRELRDLEEKKNRILFEKEKLNLKFQDLENQLRQIGKTVKDFNFEESQALPEPNIPDIEPDIEKRMFKLRTELSAMGEIDESLVKETQEVETHYNFLTSQSKDLDKAIIDLKNLIKKLNEKIHFEFNSSLHSINEEFNKFFRLMFNGGQAKLRIKNYELRIKNDNDNNSDNDNEFEERQLKSGVEINLSLPKKRISSLEMLSGGEKSLVSIAALFALISISPPPFLVLDEIDAALDENNSKRFANLIKEFSRKTQFIVVTHNRAVMESADVLYGITMGEEGTSKVLSLKLEA
ncbi:AAA family ATPase [Candidatus Wolfebacteria bacterium]|nr:AAA family ATPase [Candidatus Wolfebacteria bacterium]